MPSATFKFHDHKNFGWDRSAEHVLVRVGGRSRPVTRNSRTTPPPNLRATGCFGGSGKLGWVGNQMAQAKISSDRWVLDADLEGQKQEQHTKVRCYAAWVYRPMMQGQH